MKALRWFTIFKKKFTSDDLEDEILYALLNYLVDLELLVHLENDSFRWSGSANDLKGEEQIALIQADLLRVSQTKSGFALPFFIRLETIELPTLESLIETED